MELKDRIAWVRKAAGLSQEQLGERLGVTRQAVSKWESGQSVPDAATVARLCEALGVSADFVLLGREPAGGAVPPVRAQEGKAAPCPACGRTVLAPAGAFGCPACGYRPEAGTEDDGHRYALLATYFLYSEPETADKLCRYCGYSEEQAKQTLERFARERESLVLSRGLTAGAARWLYAHLGECGGFTLRIVPDDEPAAADSALLDRASVPALCPPPATEAKDGLGFWGVVGAVIVALLILSFL